MKLSLLCTSWLLGVSLLVGGTSAFGQGKKSDAHVKMDVKATPIDDAGKQQVTIRLKIDDGWNIYANPVMNEALASIQTSVKILADTPPKVDVTYPKGEKKIDNIVGNYLYYIGEVTITAQVARAAGDRSPLTVRVNVSACDKDKCLQPADIEAQVK